MALGEVKMSRKRYPEEFKIEAVIGQGPNRATKRATSVRTTAHFTLCVERKSTVLVH